MSFSSPQRPFLVAVLASALSLASGLSAHAQSTPDFFLHGSGGTANPPTVTSILPATLTITQGGSGTLTVTISAAQPTDTAVAVSATTGGIVSVPATVTVPANQTSAPVTVGTLAPGTAMVAASLNGTTAEAAVQVLPSAPALVSLTLSPLTVVQEATGTLMVTLNAVQQTSTVVSLSVDQTTVLQVPASVTVPSGHTQASFTVTGVAVGDAVVTAMLDTSTQSANVHVISPPPTVVALAPNPLMIQQGATGTLTLTINAAQLTDTVIPLTNSAPAVLQAPSSVTVPAGQTSATFPVTGLTLSTATVTASINSTSASATVQVTPPPTVVTGLTPGTVTVPKGTPAVLHGVVSPASTEPQSVTLTSNDTAVATVPATVPIPAGALGADFPVLSVREGSATITASLNGGTASALVVVSPAELVTLTLSPQTPTVFVGQTDPFTATGTFTDGTTKDLATSVTWTSSNQNVATLNTSGVASALAAGTTTITAASGSLTANTTLTVLTPPALSLTPGTASLRVGDSLTMTVTSAAPVETGGLTVTLSQSGTGSVTMPATVVIPEGQSSATFTVTGATAGSVTLTASAPIRLSAGSTLTITVISPPPAVRAHYVRAGASGANTGQDWTNAYSQLPSTLIRGDVYYIADGTYPGYTFDDAESGTELIYVKKATVADHGTEAGWQAAYGDGRAQFGTLTFARSHYVLDGQVGGGPTNWTSGLGFYIFTHGKGIQSTTSGVSHITIRHVEIEGHGDDGATASNDLIYLTNAHSHWVFSHLYLHDAGRTHFLWRSTTDSIIEYCYMARNESTSAQHSEGISAYGGTARNTVRYNVWEDVEGTGVIMVAGSGWNIYGNVIFWTGNPKYGGTGNGAIGGWSDDPGDPHPVSNTRVHHNTVVNGTGGSSGIRFFSDGGQNSAFNNLFYNCQNFNAGKSGFAGVAADYSLIATPSGSYARATANDQIMALNPSLFVDASHHDYRLAMPTKAGLSLGPPFDRDLLGQARGADGVWDRGADEFGGGSLPTVSIRAEDALASEPGADTGTFVVSRSGSTSLTLTVNLSVGGTAASGQDYAPLPASVTIPAGAGSASLTLSPLDDSLAEGNETVILTLTAGTGYTIGSPASASLTLVDDDGSGPGSGLSAVYYDNMDFTVPKLTRTDATVNFNWGSGSPHPSMGIDTFSVRWMGQVQPQFSQTYTFYTRSDDGVRLWVGGQLLIDKWVNQAPTEWSGTIALVAGQRYDLKLEFFENVGAALVELRWSSPSTTKQIIPTSALFPPGPSPPAVSVAATDATASEPGSDRGSFALTRAGSTGYPLTVNVSWGGSATNGFDYSAQPTTLTFPAGPATVSVSVMPTDDALVEGTETVVLTVLAGPGYQVGSPSSATVTLADNDVPLSPTRYVRAGATGAGNGLDWSNAFTQLPATLTRGTTYLVASGTYPGYTFDDPEQGSTSIEIRKATALDHGTEAGWQASYGVGPATFGPLTFGTGHYVVDGRVGGGPAAWTSGHGFKVKGTAAQQKLVRLGAGTLPSEAVSDVRLAHIELEHRGRNTETSDDGLYGFFASNITLSDCYLHDMARVPFLMRNWTNVTIERCYMARNSSSPVQHAEGISDSGSDNVVIRYNVWKDIEGTGFIVILGNGGAADNWQIYGNVFFHSAQYGIPPNDEGVSGIVRVLNDATNASVANNWSIHNNSLINIQGLWSGFRIDAGTNNVASNNLWYNSVRTAHSGVSLSHSWYFNTVRDGDSANVEIGTGDPFRDISSEDFHLIAPTAPGRVLASPYDTDMEGSPRGADGVWDRGAFEFTGGGVSRPPTVNLTTSGTSFTAPATIVLTATAADPDGSIAQVEFFQGPTLLGTLSNAPYSFTWSNVAAGQYTLTAKAKDNAGATTVSSPVSVTITGGGADPIPTLGLKLWLKADAGVSSNGGTVSRWADQSGSGNDATQTGSASQPTIVANAVNGKPALRFDGINDFMTFSLPVNTLSGVTLVLVSGNSQDRSSLLQSRAEYAALFWNETANWGTLYLSPFQTTVSYRFGTTQRLNWPLNRRPASIGSSFTTSMAMKDGATDSLWVNGTLVMSEGGKLTTMAACRDVGNLGRGHDDNTYFPGDIAEVLVYTRALTEAERAAVEQYLRDKYFTASNGQ